MDKTYEETPHQRRYTYNWQINICSTAYVIRDLKLKQHEIILHVYQNF